MRPDGCGGTPQWPEGRECIMYLHDRLWVKGPISQARHSIQVEEEVWHFIFTREYSIIEVAISVVVGAFSAKNPA